MSKTYYFVKMEHINLPPEGLTTNQQLTLDETRLDADPISSLKVIDEDYYKGWTRLEAVHESVDKTPRRMAGDPEYLHQSIVGGDRPFYCYLNSEENIMIMNTSKTNLVGLQRRLIQRFPKMFKPEQGNLDFKSLLKHIRDTEIVSSWFNNIQGKVNAVGLYGRKVNMDEIFNHYNEIGKLSAITVEWSLEDEEPLNVMFTKRFGVVIHSNWEINKDLEFLFKIKSLFFNESDHKE